MTDDKGSPQGKPDQANTSAWVTRLSIVASLIAVLAFFGITSWGQLWHELNSQPSPTSTATDSPSFTYSTFTTQSLPATAISPPPDTYPPTPSPSIFNPDSLNNMSTDRTPFKAAALLPLEFTDDQGIRYKRIASDPRPCGGSASSDVRSVLNQVDCVRAMTGDYVVQSNAVTDNNDILVNVQVMPLSDEVAAQAALDSFQSGTYYEFGIWCPAEGTGSDDCSSSYQGAQKFSDIGYDHRYLIEATALWTDLSPNQGTSFLSSAVAAAVANSGPQNYPGNQS